MTRPYIIGRIFIFGGEKLHIFIGCSSKQEIAKEYHDVAKKVGTLLKDHDIIIGGTEEGMMGDTVSHHKRFKRIILKDYLKNNDFISPSDIICNTSFERLQKIWEHTDLFLFLPGGIGTLSEIVTFLEENRTKPQKKKIILLNTNDYYQEFIAFIEKTKRLKFNNHDVLKELLIIQTIEELQRIIKGEKKNERS